MRHTGLYQYSFEISYEGVFTSHVYESEQACLEAMNSDSASKKYGAQCWEIVSWKSKEEQETYSLAQLWVDYKDTNEWCVEDRQKIKEAYNKAVEMGLIQEAS